MPINNFRTPEGDLENQSYITESWLVDQWIGDELWVWGENSSGSLGINFSTFIYRCTPVTTFAGGTNWKQVASSRDSSAGIKSDGTLWTWGGNTSNRLGNIGDNTIVNRSTPVTTFLGGTNWKQVSCGYSHKAAIKTDGTLWVWGGNFYAQLGTNNAITRSTPVTTFAGGNDWKQVSCGYYFSAAIKTDGTLWYWGQNYGGDNTTFVRSTPVTTFAGGNNWKQVDCGLNHFAAIKTDGTLWVWGGNSDGALGTNSVIDISTPVTTFAGGNNWKQVSCGNFYTSAIKTDGTLWVWGEGLSGKLGTNNQITISTPVTTFAGGSNWKSVSCGTIFTTAIKTDGTLWAWGESGRIGINVLLGETLTPVTTFLGGNNWKQVTANAGSFHTLAVTSGPDY